MLPSWLSWMLLVVLTYHASYGAILKTSRKGRSFPALIKGGPLCIGMILDLGGCGEVDEEIYIDDAEEPLPPLLQPSNVVIEYPAPGPMPPPIPAEIPVSPPASYPNIVVELPQPPLQPPPKGEISLPPPPPTVEIITLPPPIFGKPQSEIVLPYPFLPSRPIDLKPLNPYYPFKSVEYNPLPILKPVEFSPSKKPIGPILYPPPVQPGPIEFSPSKKPIGPVLYSPPVQPEPMPEYNPPKKHSSTIYTNSLKQHSEVNKVKHRQETLSPPVPQLPVVTAPAYGKK